MDKQRIIDLKDRICEVISNEKQETINKQAEEIMTLWNENQIESIDAKAYKARWLRYRLTDKNFSEKIFDLFSDIEEGNQFITEKSLKFYLKQARIKPVCKFTKEFSKIELCLLGFLVSVFQKLKLNPFYTISICVIFVFFLNTLTFGFVCVLFVCINLKQKKNCYKQFRDILFNYDGNMGQQMSKFRRQGNSIFYTKQNESIHEVMQ